MFPTAPASPASAELDPLEEFLSSILPDADTAPMALHRAMRHAVFPGGKRIRPRLLLTVAAACAADEAELELAMHAACAIELIHSASLVHDDLPCFDDARQRRGRPTVHMIYGEPLAVLAGDALLTRAFELMAETSPRLARRALRIVRLLGQATGSREGIIGGQSLEQSAHANRSPAGTLGFAPDILDRYHAMKTAALFRLAAEAGATAAGATDAPAWAEVGQCLGLAYQLADDLCDTCGSQEAAGKPVRRDVDLGRPNAVVATGEQLTRTRLQGLLDQALARTAALAAEPKPLVSLIEELSGHFMRTTTT
jgi:geranylgeranyl diphosphate synthase type II